MDCFQQLVQIAIERRATEAKIIPAHEIILDERVILKCQAPSPRTNEVKSDLSLGRGEAFALFCSQGHSGPGILELQALEGGYPCEAPDGIQGKVIFNGKVEEDGYPGGKFLIGCP